MEEKNELDIFLDGQIKEKQIILSNLKAEEKRLRIKAEYDYQLEKLREKKKENIEKINIVNLRDSIVSKEYLLNQKEDHLNNREKEIIKREQMTFNLEKQQQILFENRRDFVNYMKEQNKIIEDAQEIVEQAKVQKDVIKQKEDDLFALEERILNKKEQHDKREFEIIQKEKELNIKKANFDAFEKGGQNA